MIGAANHPAGPEAIRPREDPPSADRPEQLADLSAWSTIELATGGSTMAITEERTGAAGYADDAEWRPRGKRPSHNASGRVVNDDLVTRNGRLGGNGKPPRVLVVAIVLFAAMDGRTHG
jgi:hypothetical protein